MKNWLKLKKLSKESDLLEQKHKKFQQTDEYKKMNEEERHNEDSVFYNIDYLPIWEEIEEIRTNEFIKKLEKYGIPYPSFWDDKSYWEEGHYGSHYLTRNGYHNLRNAIREEQKAKREAVLCWMPLITALTGFLGTLAAVLSVIRYWNK